MQEGAMQLKKSGKHQMMSGIMQLMWAELKTMNMYKLKSLYKIASGYIAMKYFGPKKITKRKDRRDVETSFRVSR